MSILVTWAMVGLLQGVEDTVPTAGLELQEAPRPYVETRGGETVLRGKPWVPNKRVGTLGPGTRLVVRGRVRSRDPAGCAGADWLAVWPFGFVCSRDVRAAAEPPSHGPALPVPEGRALPYQYAMVRAPEAPQFASEADAASDTATRTVRKGMSLAVLRTVTLQGRRFVEGVDGALTPRDAVGFMGSGSPWIGVDVDVPAGWHGPVAAWVRRDDTPALAEPDPGSAVRAKLGRRARVQLLEADARELRPAFWRTEHGWIAADRLSELHVIAPPAAVLRDGAPPHQWIDVDVGEQVLTVYREARPIFATLVSSGKGSPTPLGTYPVWAKVTAMDMASQDYEDEAYLVQQVPWVLLFQGHNALHGAYWHDRFGERRSHG